MAKNDKRLARYRTTITENFPDLRISTLEYLAEGWDSVVCVVNGEWIFRFPKRKAVAKRLLNIEVPLLAALGPTLPLPVPKFEYVSGQGRKTCLGYRRLKGEPLDDCPPEIKEAEWWRPPVAQFLVALHAFPIEQAHQLGAQPLVMVREYQENRGHSPNREHSSLPQQIPEPATYRGHSPLLHSQTVINREHSSLLQQIPQRQGWRQALEDFYTATRNQIYPLLDEAEQDKIADGFEAFLDDERFFQFDPALLHGDFSPEHVLLDLENERVSGIIDFGDVAIGDPAYDVWENLLPYYPHAADPTFAERCRFYKKLPPLHALLFGQETGDMALMEYGRYELERLW